MDRWPYPTRWLMPHLVFFGISSTYRFCTWTINPYYNISGFGKSMVFLGPLKALDCMGKDYLAVIITPLVALSENHKRSLEKVRQY